jgi:FkbM family methyltransferase
MSGKERFRDYLAFKIVNVFQATFKARLMDKLPLYKEAVFCKGVHCYISSSVELKRSLREFDPQMYAWLKNFKPGEVFYDIGANIGMFSLTVAKIHNKKVAVYAFEPSFSTFASLVRNVVANRFGDVIFPFSFALGSVQGLRNFNYTDIASGASVHTLDTVVNQTGSEFTPAFSQRVVSYTLDGMITNFDLFSPTHIKIDVDGGEYEIIEGMRQILNGSSIRSVMIEITETHENDEKVKGIMDTFKNAGFKESLRIDHSQIKTYPIVSDILFTKNWELTNA